MNSLISHPNHVLGLKSLHKDLLRNTRRITKLDADKINIKSSDDKINNELKFLKINHKGYLQYLSDEIKYVLKQKMKTRLDNTTIFMKWYSNGIEFNEALKHEDLNEILRYVIAYRNDDFKDCANKYQDYHQNGILEFNGKLPKNDLDKFAFPLISYDKMTNSERLKKFKHLLHESKLNKFKTTRRYIKHLQLNQRIAIPQLLPYTDYATPKTNISEKIFKSTSSRAFKQGYNFKILESIILPEMEHIINHQYYIEKVRSHIDKGPYQPKIRFSSAGVKVGFLQLPTPKLSTMRKIAMIGKKSSKLTSLIELWESDGQTEKSNKDGSFDIAWCKLYGDNIMFPKKFLENLYDQEAIWEYLTDNDGKDFESYINTWRHALQITSDSLNNQLINLTKNYKQPYLKNLGVQQKHLIKEFNDQYQQKLDKYNRLVTILDEKSWTMHSDLINLDKVVTPMIDDKIIRDDYLLKRARTGIPYNERMGQNKRLSDYMYDVKLPHYKIGMKYDKKFTVNM